MLTDKDKVDLFNFLARSARLSRSDVCRLEVATYSVVGTLHFITNHPGLCAAEINDYILRCKVDPEYAVQELKRYVIPGDNK